MTILSARRAFAPLRSKLVRLGVDQENDLSVILSKIKDGNRLDRGEDILAAGCSTGRTTVLLEGIACLYERLPDGSRQIFSFQYPGDFCDLGRHVMETGTDVAVAAVTDCRIGFVENHVLDQMVVQYPALGLALWRVSVIEAAMLRARLLSRRRTALQHVAHLLSEQLAHQAAVGIDDSTVPISQINLADAAGLSVVHINRTFKELQALGLLAKVGRSMKVVDRERLARLADFDGGYLNMPSLLERWHVRIQGLDALARVGDHGKKARQSGLVTTG